MAWITLIVAGLFETAWAIALKQSEGFSRIVPTAAFVVALIISMLLLATALKSLPVGTGYAVWTGIGAVGAAIVGIVFLGEPSDLGRIAPIGLIAVGIVWLALGEEAGA